MLQKIFKNRMTQETASTIHKMKSVWIDNMDKTNTEETAYGLFAITLNPNSYVDEITLENVLKSILSHFYQWRYGSKWQKLKDIQTEFEGIIEKQQGFNHIHLTVYQPNIEEFSLFASYITKMFKALYIKASHKIKRIYDIDGWNSYVSPFFTHKDRLMSKKRTSIPTFISSDLFKPALPKN